MCENLFFCRIYINYIQPLFQKGYFCMFLFLYFMSTCNNHEKKNLTKIST